MSWNVFNLEKYYLLSNGYDFCEFTRASEDVFSIEMDPCTVLDKYDFLIEGQIELTRVERLL